MPTISHLIVGAHFRPPAKAILQVLPSGAKLSLVREPTNQYDENALAVFVESREIPPEASDELDTLVAGYGTSAAEIMATPAFQLGYLPAKEMALIVDRVDAKLQDENKESLEAKLIFGFDGKPMAQFEL